MSYTPPPQYNYGAPPPPPRKSSSPWPWIVGFGCGIPLLLIGGCVAFTAITVKKVIDDPEVRQAWDTATKNQAAEKTSFDPAAVRYVKDPATGLLHAKGVITNKTDAKLPYLQVKFACLDAEGDQIDTAMASITDLGPQAQWKFDVAAEDATVKKMKLLGISTTPLEIESGGGKTSIRFDGSRME